MHASIQASRVSNLLLIEFKQQVGDMPVAGSSRMRQALLLITKAVFSGTGMHMCSVAGEGAHVPCGHGRAVIELTPMNLEARDRNTALPSIPRPADEEVRCKVTEQSTRCIQSLGVGVEGERGGEPCR